MKKIGVIGAGSFGTALAQTLADKGHSVRLTSVTRSHLEEMAESRENSRYLPGIKLNDNIEIAYSTEEALEGADIALLQLLPRSSDLPSKMRFLSLRTI